MLQNNMLAFAFLVLATAVHADETFVIIHGVNDNHIQISREVGGQGMGPRGPGGGGAEARPPGGMGRRRGRFGGGAADGAQSRARSGGQAEPQLTTVAVPATARITTAMRERRTFEFRVMGEIAGGLRNPIFSRMQEPIQARIVTVNNTITEINVISGDTDINQTSTSPTGGAIIAVKPKRPPARGK